MAIFRFSRGSEPDILPSSPAVVGTSPCLHIIIRPFVIVKLFDYDLIDAVWASGGDEQRDVLRTEHESLFVSFSDGIPAGTTGRPHESSNPTRHDRAERKQSSCLIGYGSFLPTYFPISLL